MICRYPLCTIHPCLVSRFFFTIPISLYNLKNFSDNCDPESKINIMNRASKIGDMERQLAIDGGVITQYDSTVYIGIASGPPL